MKTLSFPRAVLALMVLWTAACSDDPAPSGGTTGNNQAQGCGADSECPGGVCEEGACVYPEEDADLDSNPNNPNNQNNPNNNQPDLPPDADADADADARHSFLCAFHAFPWHTASQ